VKARQGLRDGVNVDGRGKKDQIIVHSYAEEIQAPKPDIGAQSEANAMIGHQNPDKVDHDMQKAPT
jgi:hypothetical protein